MNTKATKTSHFRFESALLWFLSALFMVALALYAYFIMTSVVQVVLRQELQVELGEVETRISGLEAEYFARSSTISEETAGEFGLVAVTPSAYVEVAPLGDRLTRKD